LSSCYRYCLDIVREQGFKSVAFPCIATGFYGFPNEDAAHIAYCSVQKFLEQEPDVFITFVLFNPIDVEIYNRLFEEYFPVN
jgi:O-acetyl-ADP-ribose deacetylase (regulator of RNase III)